MRGKYYIEKLSSNSKNIVPIINPSKKERKYFQILGGTFSSVEDSLRIRPNAVEFVKSFGDGMNLPIYAIIYKDSEFTEILWVFTYKKYESNSESILYKTRCVGKNVVNQHKYRFSAWDLQKAEKQITSLKDGEFISQIKY